MLDFGSTRRLLGNAYELTVSRLAASYDTGNAKRNDSDKHELPVA
jgi:hypothetical protein